MDGLESVTQAQIDSTRSAPGIQEALAALTGTDEDGTPVAVATIRLIDTDDERIQDAERTINELAAADDGPLRVSSVSPLVIEDAYKKATEEGTAPLIGLALLLIAALLLLFLRTPADLPLTLGGLLIALIWVIGAEGWLGPDALDLIGPPSSLTALVPELLQEFLDRLRVKDPAVAHVLVDNPEGVDSLLIQFPAYTGDPDATKALQEDIEALWFGEDGTVTASSGSIISLTVTDEITGRQTQAISTTIAVAVGILAIFFWVTLRQPVLALVAVAPIVFVLIWVLGTMALLGIPYTLVTSIITALSIGIGVDYTIHIIHRYREEFSRLRNPEQAAIRTLATAGSALLGSALTTALGLGALVLSPLLASQQFGITAAITIAYSLIVSIVLVPPAMTVWGSYQNMRLRSMVERTWAELDVAIEDVNRRHEQEQESS